MSAGFTPKQIEALALVEKGEVKSVNFGYGAWRTVGANPTVIGRLVSMGAVRFPFGGNAELTDNGVAALAKARGEQ